MERHDRDLRRALDEMRSPPLHRPGFWEDIEDELAGSSPDDDDVPAHDEIGDMVRLGTPPRRSIPPWRAAATAAAVVLLLGAGTALLRGPSTEGESSAAAAPAAVAAGAPVAIETGRPPWAAPPLAQREAPRLLRDEWRGAANRRWCSAMTPSPLEAEEATPRAAGGFPGGWGVAWDRPDGPGQLPDGTDCPDCGRSAFGVAGTGLVASADIGLRRPVVSTWDDGSRVGFGGGGLEASTQRQTAEIVLEGQGCVYEVWSNLGHEHLVGLVERLRFVDGLEAPPVELRRPGDPQQVEAQRSPPWSGPTMTPSEVPELLLAQAEAMGAEPVLAFADLSVSAVDVLAIRTWDSGVAWDAPNGPGHDGRNRPCAECGRGVIGLGWRSLSPAPSDEVSLPYRIEWEDGSYAEYGSRTADPALPLDRVVFLDPDTGQRVEGAYQALVRIAGSEQELVVWTHLGERHLLRLLDALRLVEPD